NLVQFFRFHPPYVSLNLAIILSVVRLSTSLRLTLILLQEKTDNAGHILLVLLGHISGGADRDRTGGLLVANQALSQLSYSPMTAASSFEPRASSYQTCMLIARSSQLMAAFLVGLGRVELPTSPLSGVRSSHLSYRPGYSPKIPKL